MLFGKGATTRVNAMAGLDVDLITDPGQFRSLAGAWDDLLSRSAAPEVFSTHDWVLTWWEVFGGESGRALRILTVREGGTLVGLAPFVLRRVGPFGPAQIRRLDYLGTGEDEADEVCSYFEEILAAKGYEARVCQAVWDYLTSQVSGWDEMALPWVLEESNVARHLLPRVRDAGATFTVVPADHRYFVDLSDGDFKGYLGRLSKKRSKRYETYSRKLEKEGFSERRLADPAEFPAFLGHIARLSHKRRTSKGGPSAWDSEKFRAFQQRLLPRLWEKGWLDLRVWEKEGQVLAALYHLVYGGVLYGYQIGIDTRAFGSVSPGLVMILRTIDWTFRSQLRRFDFLLGADGSYKEDYGCATQATVELTVYNRTLAARLLRSAREVHKAIKNARVRVEAPAPQAPSNAGQP